jgi:prepilin-type N-terminal cleavage/methylation domain-containing protein
MRKRAQAEGGFTLIELLVVILIIGILAAIAIPSFLSQRGKATDASAKEMVRTGAQAAETYSTDHAGEYTGMEPSTLKEYESAIQTSAGNGSRIKRQGIRYHGDRPDDQRHLHDHAQGKRRNQTELQSGKLQQRRLPHRQLVGRPADSALSAQAAPGR